MIINLLQQVSDFFVGVPVLVAPIGHEEVHDSTVGTIGDRIELHKVLVLGHLMLLGYRCQRLDGQHKWRRHDKVCMGERRVSRYNNAHKTHVEVEVTVTRKAERRRNSELTRMWAERKRGGRNFIKSPTYKGYGTSGKNHATRKEARMRTSDNIDVSGTYRHGTSGELREEKHYPPAK